MKRYITSIAALAIMTAASFPSIAEAQWSGPTQSPTGGNVSAPINVGTSAQVKNGGLSVNAFTAWLDSYFAGNVGLGIISPQAKLQVMGTLFVNNTADATGGLYYGGATNGLILGNYAASPWPGTNGLYVAGPLTAAGTVKITSGTPGVGKVLTSDATGLAAWATPAVGSEADPTVLASVKDGITWTEVASRPAGLDDGDQVGVTSVTAGTGLTGGTITTSGTVAADTSYLQRRVSGTCAGSQAIGSVNSDGTVGCISPSFSESDTLATVTARGASANTAITVPSLSFSGVGGDSGQPAPNNDYRIYQSPGAWTYPYPDLNIAYHTGIKLGAYWNYGGTRFYNNSDMVTELFSVGNGDNNVRVANNLYAAGNVGIGSSGVANQSLVVGNDLGALAGGSSKGVVFGNTGGSFYQYTGQDSTHNLSSSWIYNASPSSGFGQIQTFSRSNPLYVDGSQLYLNAQSSAGNVGIGTTNPGTKLEVAGSGYVQIDPNDGRLDIGSGNDGLSYVDFKGSGNLASDYRGRFAYDDGAGFKAYTGGSGTASLAITEAGQVGLGTLVPSYKLDVNGDVINNGWFRSRGATGWYNESYGGGWYMQDATWIRSYNSKPVYMSAGFDTGAAVGIGCGGGLGGGYTMQVCGNQIASAYYYSSDRSLKENIVPLSGSLNKILKLQGVSFDWKKGGDTNIGLVAQDVENVYPELVNTDEKTGLKAVEYGNLVAPLIEAVKDQQEQIDFLKAEIKALKASK